MITILSMMMTVALLDTTQRHAKVPLGSGISSPSRTLEVSHIYISKYGPFQTPSPLGLRSLSLLSLGTVALGVENALGGDKKAYFRTFLSAFFLTKTLFSTKHNRAYPHVSLWGIYNTDPKAFFRLDKSKGSNQLVKN